jgi:hypothetical protein
VAAAVPNHRESLRSLSLIVVLFALGLPAAASAQSSSSTVSITILPPKKPLAAAPADPNSGPGSGTPLRHPRVEPGASYSKLTGILTSAISVLVLVFVGLLILILIERARQALRLLAVTFPFSSPRATRAAPRSSS